MNNELYLHQIIGERRSNEVQYPYFGDGSDGVLNVTGDTTFYSSKDQVIVKYYKSINIGSSGLLTVSNPCAGLILYSLGDVVIDGTISMNQKGNINPSKYRPYIITKNFYPKFTSILNFFMSNRGYNELDNIGILPSGGRGGSGGDGGNGGKITGKEPTSGGSGGYVSSNLVTYCGGTGGAGGGGGGGKGGDSYYQGQDGASGGGYISHIEYYPGGGSGGTWKENATKTPPSKGNNGGSGGGGGAISYSVAYGRYGNSAPGGGGGGGGAIVNHGGGAKGSSGQYPGGLIIIICGGNIILNGKITAEGGIGGKGDECYYTLYSGGNISDWSGSGGGGGGAGGGIVGIFHAGTFNNKGSISVAGGIGGASPSYLEKGGGTPGHSGGVGSIKIQQVLK